MRSLTFVLRKSGDHENKGVNSQKPLISSKTVIIAGKVQHTVVIAEMSLQRSAFLTLVREEENVWNKGEESVFAKFFFFSGK